LGATAHVARPRGLAGVPDPAPESVQPEANGIHRGNRQRKGGAGDGELDREYVPGRNA